MLEQVILGIIQGIFEWLPISSQGITALLSGFFIKDIRPIDFALFLHIGTVLAVIVYFYKDWQKIILLKNYRGFRFIAIATVVSLIVGFPIYRAVSMAALGTSLLLIVGFGLLATAYFHKKEQRLDISEKKLAVLVGFLQGLAVIPGLSRSGSTIFGLSLARQNPKEILKLSYLMSVPVVLVSSIYLIIKTPNIILIAWPGLIVSFLIGIIVLHSLIKISQRINFFKFTLIFAILCFIGAIIDFIV